MATRADRIFAILTDKGKPVKTGEIAKLLATEEKLPSLFVGFVTATVNADNRTRDQQGRAMRFNTYGNGNEAYGFISVRTTPKAAKTIEDVLKDYPKQLPLLIESSNKKAKDALKEAIGKLSWREFESNFLARILEVLGFVDIQITQPGHDGGKDALATYKRGLVQSSVIVSAKHWRTSNVGADEVQRLRGIKGEADTGIIVTSSSFASGAKTEAAPSQNQRAIVLVDGELIVETCLENGIGVRVVTLQKLYEFRDLKSDIE